MKENINIPSIGNEAEPYFNPREGVRLSCGIVRRRSLVERALLAEIVGYIVAGDDINKQAAKAKLLAVREQNRRLKRDLEKDVEFLNSLIICFPGRSVEEIKGLIESRINGGVYD